jgi:hypothetical protein
MTCTNTIQEYNSKRQCWFPRDPTSPFELCKHCNFHKVDTILQDIGNGKYHDILLVNEPKFLETCLDMNLQEHVLNALGKLLQKDQLLFKTLFTFLNSNTHYDSKVFLKHAIFHTPSSRCCIYRQWFKQRKLPRDPVATDLPIQCWDCLSWILRQKDMLGLYQPFIRLIASSKILGSKTVLESLINCDKNALVDSMVSLELKGKAHTARILFTTFYTRSKNETLSEFILISFFSHPAIIDTFFLEPQRALEYIPYSLRSTDIVTKYQKKILQTVRKRNWVFKEDLMIKTWAPHRLFTWCFDLEELKDF